MKPQSQFPSVFCLVLPLFFSIVSTAQTSSVNDASDIHTKGYFVKMAQRRFIKILDTAAKQQASEQATILRLEAKSDSTLKAIQNDSANYSARLRNLRTYNDTLGANIKLLQVQVASTSIIAKNYTALNNQFKAFDEEITARQGDRFKLLALVDRQIDSAGLSGEQKKLKTILNSASAQQQKEAAKVTAIGGSKDSLLHTGNIDPSTSQKLDQRLQRYQQRLDSLNKEIIVVKAKLDSPTEFKKDLRLIKARVLLIDSVVNKGAASREYVFTMIDEGLRFSKPNLFSLAAFFGAGGYSIPREKYPLARQYFSPLVDSLIKFSNKYATIVRLSSVAVNGYADASSIGAGSKLYQKLSAYLKKSSPTKQELNAALSALRAEDLSQFITMLIKEKSTEFEAPQKIVFESLEEGMGEKFPDARITDYKANDERRRIVIIYWSVLPG